jgi:hypothetical protein
MREYLMPKRRKSSNDDTEIEPSGKRILQVFASRKDLGSGDGVRYRAISVAGHGQVGSHRPLDRRRNLLAARSPAA